MVRLQIHSFDPIQHTHTHTNKHCQTQINTRKQTLPHIHTSKQTLSNTHPCKQTLSNTHTCKQTNTVKHTYTCKQTNTVKRTHTCIKTLSNTNKQTNKHSHTRTHTKPKIQTHKDQTNKQQRRPPSIAFWRPSRRCDAQIEILLKHRLPYCKDHILFFIFASDARLLRRSLMGRNLRLLQNLKSIGAGNRDVRMLSLATFSAFDCFSPTFIM